MTGTAADTDNVSGTKPIMGGAIKLKDADVAWRGGEPNPLWTGLNELAPTEPASPNQFRREDSGAEKGYNFRRKGRVEKFKSADNFLRFTKNVWEHLKDTGMDTNAFMPDPSNPTGKVINFVFESARYAGDMMLIRDTLGPWVLKFDKYSKSDEIAAKEFLLDSLEESLRARVEQKLLDGDGFIIAWAQLERLVRGTSINQHERTKATIRSKKVSAYSGENVESYCAEMRRLCEELFFAGQFDHNLLLAMIDNLLLAGGDGNEDYRFPLRTFKSKLEDSLRKIAYINDASAKEVEMELAGMTYIRLFDAAETSHFKQAHEHKWPPARNSTQDRRAVPAAFANNALVQQSSGSNLKGTCHNCGQTGHWKRDCPTKSKSGGPPFTKVGPKGKHGGGGAKPVDGQKTSWRTTAPASGAPKTMNRNDKTFHWCAKCARWTTSHDTEGHHGTGGGKGGNEPKANTAQFPLIEEPCAWVFEAPSKPVWLIKLHLIGVLLAVPLLAVFLTCVGPQVFLWLMHAQDLVSWLIGVILAHPAPSVAPFTWLLAFVSIVLLGKFPIPPDPVPEVPIKVQSRRERRHEAQATHRFHRKLCRLPRPGGIKEHHLHKKYPLNRRAAGLYAAGKPPTLEVREMSKQLSRLQQVANKLEREVARLRRPSPKEGAPRKMRAIRKVVVGRGRDPDRPMPEDPPVEANIRQAHAAQQLLVNTEIRMLHPSDFGIVVPEPGAYTFPVLDDLSALRAAMLAPLKVRASVKKECYFPVIFDSGASLSLSPDRDDFVGPLQKANMWERIDGFVSGSSIAGKGHVAWSFTDDSGMLRTLKLPAYYVPKAKHRLLSTTSYSQTYGENYTGDGTMFRLSGTAGNSQRGAITASVHPRTNIPTAFAYQSASLKNGARALAQTVSTVSAGNMNLSESEKELLKWHYRLGHPGFRRLQFLFRGGVLSRSEDKRKLHTTACKLTEMPKCAACQFGRQTRRTEPGKSTTIIKDRAGVLRADHLSPGQRVSVDHFVSSVKGRLFSSRGKSNEEDMYMGGAIFVDHCSNYVHVEFQKHLTSHATLRAKEAYESMCRDVGVVPQSYLSDNSKTFTSVEFSQQLSEFKQVAKFAGAGAHHHNGIAERAIQTIMSMARTMMLHAAIHWPDVADSCLWPMAVRHAVFIYNHLPSLTTGVCPTDLFTRSRWEQAKFHDFHTFGAPVYVLDKAISDGKKLPKWKPRSQRMIYMGHSPAHASTVPLVLNPSTGAITAQFHCVVDDWFSTVTTDVDSLPDFNSAAWASMFGDSTFLYPSDEDEEVAASDANDSATALERESTVSHAMDYVNPVQPLFLPPPIPKVVQPTVTAPTIVPPREPVQSEQSTLPPRELPPTLPPREPNPPTTSPPREPPASPREPPAAPTAVSPQREKEPDRKSTRSGRASLPPKRYGYSGEQGAGYSAALNLSQLSFELAQNFVAIPELPPTHVPHYNAFLKDCFAGPHDNATGYGEPHAFAAKSSDPDTLSYDEAMASEDRDHFMQAAKSEILSLEAQGTWGVVPISDAKSRILPGTWVFRRKRTPDGTIKKYKGRYCVRGDLQEGTFETYAPVVGWPSVRIFLVMALTLAWYTCTIDYSNAFVQAVLKDEVWIHLPRGFKAPADDNRYCLRLKKSLYGLSVAPRLWYEHLISALRKEGFVPSAYDACLMVKKDIFIILYVDDQGIAAKTKELADELINNLQNKHGLELTREGSFHEFLGIKLERNETNGNLNLTQKGLISKIVSATGMEDCNPNWRPAESQPLGIDPNGVPMNEKWSYRSIVGQLLYLSTNTRPDISFAVSQVARFCHAPKQVHATAVKTIVRYLVRSNDKGTIVSPTGNLVLDCFVDADFGGLYRCDPDTEASSAKSRTGYIIKLGGAPLVWKSHLQTAISMSTLEAEYMALSSCLRTLIPLRRMLEETATRLGLAGKLVESIGAMVHEDNNGALALATQNKITSRTKYLHIAWHWFWNHVKEGFILIVKCASQDQEADFLTKPLPRDSFERNRRAVMGW